MQTNLKKPGVILAAALLVFFTGGFLLLVHIGASGRTAPARHYAPGYRGASVASSSYLEDFKRGGEIVKEKGETAFAGFFGGSAQDVPAYGRGAAAQRGGSREEEESDPDGDAFERYYKKNYASSRGGSASAGQSSWAGMGGGGYASGGYSGGGDTATSERGTDGKIPEKEEPAGEEAAGAAVPVPAAGTGFGKPPSGLERAAAPKLQASLPGRNGPGSPGLNPGGGPGSPAGGGGPYKGGSLSGMPGQKTGVPLDGAAEGMKAGAQKNYDSKAAGGASAGVAAAGGAGGSSGGGSSPAASAPKDATAEAKAAASAAKTSTGTATDEGGEAYEDYYPVKPSAPEPDLLSLIVKERQNGADAKLVSDEDAAGEPEEYLLLARAVALDETEKAVLTPDPADLKKLPEARKKELKKEAHTFLRKVENKYGKMTEIFRTSCSTTPELCKEHEVKGSYLTMTTQKGAKLVMGFKYVEKRWRRYTMDFKAPAAAVKPPPQEQPDEEPAEDASEDLSGDLSGDEVPGEFP